tara:strand:- start:3937 stop:4098 length:162 start_codon:yes stop_codon:yes gene_type:complete
MLIATYLATRVAPDNSLKSRGNFRFSSGQKTTRDPNRRAFSYLIGVPDTAPSP